MTATALFVGDVGWDITVTVPRLPGPDEKVMAETVLESPGGVVANAAVAAARVGASTRGLFCFGRDERGRAARKALGDQGVVLVNQEKTPTTSLAVILLDAEGEKHLVLYRGPSMYPTQDAIRIVDLVGVSWVHTAIYDSEAARRLIARCRSLGIKWSIDLEPATLPVSMDELREHLEGAEVVFCNRITGERLGAEPHRVLHELGVRMVILTQGASGAVLAVPGFPPTAVSPPLIPVEVVDTTGAGDCLAGCFIAQRLTGVSVVDALRVAVAAATISCTRMGAQASFPSLLDLDRKLRHDYTFGAVDGDKDKERG